MPAEPDHAILMAGLHALVERLNAGESDLAALTLLLQTANTALGSAGMILTEFGPEEARVVVGVGASTWAAGRPVPQSCRDFHLGVDGDSWDTSVSDLPPEIARQLSGRGLRRLLGTRVELGGQLVGGLHAYFSDPAAVRPEHNTMLSFIGSIVARLYGTRGLPLPAAPPAASFDKDLFIAVTSHELRTPVTAIKGWANTLDDHWDALNADERRHAVRVIGQRANDLARLVDRLLAAATLTDPAGLPLCAPFELVTTLREAAAALAPDLRTRLRVRLPESLPKAYGDRGSLATVLTELVTNATRYSDADVELWAGSDEQTVLFQVADRGVGIAPEHVEQAFVRYWQADPGGGREHPGAGLGLHLVRQIVERQKGWVSLRPRDSGGTVAEVRLPRADAAGPE